VSYLPWPLPKGVEQAEGYILRYAGKAFGPRQPLQCWIDLLEAGVKPSEVRLIGINGGRLAAFEYRLAIALGVQTGMLVGSGRQADRLLRDKEWGHARNLVPLLADPMTLWNFLHAPFPSPFSETVCERLAEDLHEQHRKDSFPDVLRLRPSQAPWAELDERYKKSSRERVRAILSVVRRAGLQCREHPASLAHQIPLLELKAEEIVEIAKVEHGRWNIERLVEGWRPGTPRDDKRQIHPDLRSWEELPDNVKEYDLKFVRRLPELLKSVGLELTRA
jgi:hypothetical protein